MSDIFGKISIEPERAATAKKKPLPKPTHRKRNDKRASRKNIIWLIIPVGIISLYSIIGFLGVPYYLGSYIPEMAAKEYNVVISPSKITFNPFNFTLKTESTKVDDNQGNSIAYLPSLELDFAAIQLLRMDFVCTQVIITSPTLNLVRNDNESYNFSPLLPSLKENTNGSGMIGFSDLPLSFSLNNISLTGGTLTFNDKPNKKTHNITDIDLHLPTLANIDFQAGDYITPHFAAVVNGSPISFKAKNTKDDSSNSQPLAQLAWEMKDFPLQDYVNYLPFEFPFSINKGTAEGIVGLKFDNLSENQEKLSINFNLTIADIDFETKQKKLQLRSPAMNITGSFIPVNKLFLVENLHFQSPEFKAYTPDLLKELSNIFLIAKKEDQLGLIEKPVVFSLQSLQFSNGKLSHKKTFNDNEAPFEWSEVEANIGNYTTHEPDSPSNNQPSIVNIKGRAKDATNVFSFMGSFEAPSTLSGKLSVDNITSQKLFSFMLPTEKSTTFSGSAKLNSVFSLQKTDGTDIFSSSLSQTNIVINNVKIINQDKPILEAEELSLSNALLDGDIVNLGSIKIKNGDLFYTQKSNTSILSKILSGRYSIASLDYTGDVHILSNTKKPSPFTLKNSSIKYSGNKTSTKKTDNIVISSLTSTGGKIEAKGTARLNPFKMELSTNFSNIDATSLTAILPQNNFISHSSGQISGKGRIAFPQTSFTGELLILAGDYLTSRERRLSWSECALENINFTTKPYHVGVGSITLNKPKLNLPVDPQKGSMDQQLTDFLRSTLQKTKIGANKQKKISPSSLDIQKITLSNGGLTLKDHRLAPTWTGKLNNINGTIENIHSANSASNSHFAFTGNIDGSDFTWRGTIDPLKDTQTDKHQLTLTSYPLSNFAKQLQPISDINFDTATISLTYSSDWINGDLSHSVRSRLSQLKVDQHNSESSLPLAILADVNGETKMDLSSIQVSPQQDSNLFNDLTGNLQKLVLKGGLSPLLLASEDFSDLMDNEFIDFRPGQFMLSDSGRKSLSRYGALLIAHPNIKLQLSGGIDLQDDKKSLHKQLEKNERIRVEKENEKLFAKWQQKKQEYESQLKNNQDQTTSTGQIAESDIPNKVLAGFRPLLPEPVVVDNEMLFDLAEKRLDIVKQHFITKLSLIKGRVEITQQSTDTHTNGDIGKGVHIEIMVLESSPLFQVESN